MNYLRNVQIFGYFFLHAPWQGMVGPYDRKLILIIYLYILPRFLYVLPPFVSISSNFFALFLASIDRSFNLPPTPPIEGNDTTIYKDRP